MRDLIYLAEPTLLFRHHQAMEDPRDGLTLFGPLDTGKPYGIRVGVVGTQAGIDRYVRWVTRIQRPIINDASDVVHPSFPGFQAAFRTLWEPTPTVQLIVPAYELDSVVRLDDQHQRVYKTVDVYSRRIIRSIDEDEVAVDMWFVIVPDEVYKYCRPESTIVSAERIHAENSLKPSEVKHLRRQPALLPEMNESAIPYQYEVQFRNQLKARLLGHGAATQIVRESTMTPEDFLDQWGHPKRRLDTASAVAWNLSTAVFYKAGGRPWKLANIREGVCYVGVVFKGAVGPWYNPESREYHLSRTDAAKLVGVAMESYERFVGQPPKELFFHGKVRFDDDEWAGFRDAVGPSTNLVGVRIREDSDLRLYGRGKYPLLRGLAYIRDKRTAFLWTRGFVPRLQTYAGMEVPRPLMIDVHRGDADITSVLGDIMALTKLNYNAAIFADGQPVTLRFADAVGEILTAGPNDATPKLPFKYYI